MTGPCTVKNKVYCVYMKQNSEKWLGRLMLKYSRTVAVADLPGGNLVMSESRFYHISKSGKLEQCDSVAEVMSRAKEMVSSGFIISNPQPRICSP